jgi:hypothetical protein
MKKEMEDAERALDRYKRGKEILKSVQISDARDMSRRIMDLDQAIQKLEKYRQVPQVRALLDDAHRAMMGGMS